MNITRYQRGYEGEKLVANFLRKQGFNLLAQNYRIRGGELDIVAQKKDLLIIVEVKTRLKHYFNLSEVITPTKQRAVIRTAQHYIAYHHIKPCIIRFDLALVEDSSLNYIANAFTQESK